ncbi:MAG: tripartite tricarboxylate transporter substrate binding protein [Burkholderiales bacterium]|nr:tripartite tricarboxylate transporter substrate binding protein [Burkholderiales bacterium]
MRAHASPAQSKSPKVRAVTLVSALAGTLMLAASGPGAPQYPAHAVALITPTTAGGAIDSSSRLLANRLTETMGQRFIVENRPGGSGVIGASAVARAKPDGYTLLFSSNSYMVSTPLLLKSMPYDSRTDFAPITEIGRIPLVLVAHPSMKVATLKAFIDRAKTAPARINYASGGEGSDHHLSMELLSAMAGIRLVHVPYKAGPQGYADLLGGHIPAMFIAPGTAARHVKEGKVMALGISSARSLEAYAGVPPVSEVLPGYEYEGWFATFAPRATPADVIARLNTEIRAILAQPEVVHRMHAIGIFPKTGTPEDLASMLVSDTERIRQLMRQTGIEAR